MALKDWKKMKTEDYHVGNYFNVSNSISLAIRMVGDKTYNVEVFKNKSGEYEVVRNFSSKSQAIAYAKSYMRTH